MKIVCMIRQIYAFVIFFALIVFIDLHTPLSAQSRIVFSLFYYIIDLLAQI